MASDDCVLDLSTGPPRSTSPYDVNAQPSISPNMSIMSESDSGLDTVDSTRNSTDDNCGPPLSPNASAISPSASVSSSIVTHESSMPSMPPMLMLPTTMPGLTLPESSADTSTPGHFKMHPYDAMTMMMTNPLAVLAGNSSTATNGLPSIDAGNPFPGSVAQLINQRRRKPNDKRSREDDDIELFPTPKKQPGTPVPSDKKDDCYWERRRRNNDAAKRSRDMRRRKEEEIAMRAAYLEQENLKLRAQVAILKNETAKLHYMLYNRL